MTEEQQIEAWVERIRDTVWADSCGTGLDSSEVRNVLKECIAHVWQEVIETAAKAIEGDQRISVSAILLRLEHIAKERGYA
jgi:hypothetical protein